MIKGFDSNLQCRGFQFEVGKEFEVPGDPVLCSNGFHFTKDLVLCFQFYGYKGTDNRYAEIEVQGPVVWDAVGHKGVSSRIKIVREIPREEIDELLSNSGGENSGIENSGYQNSGNQNAGNRNSGNRNSGNQNSGNRNSGNWNSGDRNAGMFNTNVPQTIRVFGKEIPRSLWQETRMPSFLYFEIKENETYKEAFQRSWEQADPDSRDLIYKIPGFDPVMFHEISGIRLSGVTFKQRARNILTYLLRKNK